MPPEQLREWAAETEIQPGRGASRRGGRWHVTLASVDADNSDDKFGVYADVAIGRVTVKVPTLFVSNLAATTGVDDFEVKVIG